jgi:hypothetical protein
MHLTGQLGRPGHMVYTFALSDGGRVISAITSEDLERAGYVFHSLGLCAGAVAFNGKLRPVMCDAPALAQGTNERPVVIAETAPKTKR